jgi:hypothetical protein
MKLLKYISAASPYPRVLSPSGVGGSAGGYFTQDINCSALAKGMYIVSLQTEKERLVNKFIVE